MLTFALARKDREPPARLRTGIRRAARRLLADQGQDGAWHYGNPMGPRTTALAMVVENFVGWSDPETTDACAKWIAKWQRDDGSFPAYIRADDGGVAMTATCLAGLAACGCGEKDPPHRKARAYLDAHGGLDAVDPGTRLLLAMAGVLDPKELKGNFAFYFAIPGVVSVLAKRFNPGAIMFMMALGAVTGRLMHQRHDKRLGWIFRRAARRMESFLFSLQSENGSWFDLPIATCWFVAALYGAGIPADDPRMLQARDYLRERRRTEADDDDDPEGLHLVAMDSQVWNTGLCLRAITAAGVPEHSAPCREAAEALRRMQICDEPTPKIFQPKPDAPRSGGWAFTAANPKQADTDDTGVALAGLASILRAGRADDALVKSMDLGVEWLLAMQNPDGGWAAFAHGLPKKRPGAMNATLLMNPPRTLWGRLKLFFQKPPEMGDPSTAGLTGRVLFALGELGFDARDPEIERAIDFLRDQQDYELGAWWGMWMVNWLPATACVLSGLAAVEADLDQPWVQRAARFLLAHQNEDGGWGETPASYLDKSMVGRGESMPALTGLVLTALIDIGLGDSPQVDRAVKYLLDAQDDEGGWNDEQWLQVVLFPDTLYFNGAHPNCFPLEALCRFRDHLMGYRVAAADEGGELRGPARWTDDFLDEMRLRQDPFADEVIAAVYAEGGIKALSALLARMTESDEPVPPSLDAALPDIVQNYFEATDDPPEWVDEARARFGAETFGFLAYAMIAALFTAALPEAYCAADGARVLVQTGRLERDINNRILETAQFILDVMDEGGLEPNGRGLLTAQKIRLIHAAVRHLIAHHRPLWRAHEYGLPINQEDMAGTLLTFSVIVTEGLRRLRIELDVDQQEAYLHAWRVIGYAMGVHPELIPANVIEARILMRTIRRRQQHPSEQGVELMASLLRGMRRHLPFVVPRAAPAVMVRHMIGDTRADMLRIPVHPFWRAVMQKVLAWADRYGWFSATPPGVDPESRYGRHKIGAIGRINMQMVRKIIYLQRQGKHVEFRLPQSLKKR